MKVLMVINTTGLEYDDRLRKEALSLRRLGCHVEILAMEYANQAAQRMVYGHVRAITIRLRSRAWFARSKGLWLKALEMYARFLVAIVGTHPDLIWFHSLGLMGLAPLLILMRRIGFIQHLIWDQHELPPDRLLNSKVYWGLFGWSSNGCDYVVMANDQRKDFIQQWLGDYLSTPIAVLENYPDRVFLRLPQIALPQRISCWLEDTPYLLAQGGAAPGRHFENLVAAILSLDHLKLVVVGPYQESQIRELVEHHGKEFSERVFLTGFVPQMEIVPYVDHALASVVFYEAVSENSRLCASNRLYQAVVRGTPVIVGVNPPMASFVQTCECGVVLSDDGRDVESIRAGIRLVLLRRDEFRENCEVCSSRIMWESQVSIVRDLVGVGDPLWEAA